MASYNVQPLDFKTKCFKINYYVKFRIDICYLCGVSSVFYFHVIDSVANLIIFTCLVGSFQNHIDDPQNLDTYISNKIYKDININSNIRN